LTPPTDCAARSTGTDDTDDTDAHSIALVGVSIQGLHAVVHDEQLEVLRLLVDRRRRIGADHTRTTPDGLPPPRPAARTPPGGAKKDLRVGQARKLVAGVRPRDVVGKTRKRVAPIGSDLALTIDQTGAADLALANPHGERTGTHFSAAGVEVERTTVGEPRRGYIRRSDWYRRCRSSSHGPVA
jgi:hypothetical protein